MLHTTEEVLLCISFSGMTIFRWTNYCTMDLLCHLADDCLLLSDFLSQLSQLTLMLFTMRLHLPLQSFLHLLRRRYLVHFLVLLRKLRCIQLTCTTIQWQTWHILISTIRPCIARGCGPTLETVSGCWSLLVMSPARRLNWLRCCLGCGPLRAHGSTLLNGRSYPPYEEKLLRWDMAGSWYILSDSQGGSKRWRGLLTTKLFCTAA